MTHPTQRPTWLAIAEHAALGEARARALLLERFWVLERSVDVQGADFMIQRRLLGKSLLSPVPPRFGIVQAKFIQDGRTNIRVPESYLTDGARVSDEFFLLVSTGFAGSDRMFLLSARELIDNCPIVHYDKVPSRFLSGSSLVKTPSRFEVIDKGRALDRIEHAVEKADFLANRQYIRNVVRYVDIDPSHIDDDYQLPIENWYGDFRSGFYEMKKRFRSVLDGVEEVADALREILESSDPITAWEIFETKAEEHMVGGRIVFDIGSAIDHELIVQVHKHRRKVDDLRTRGLEAAYMHLLREFEDRVIAAAPSHLPFARDDGYQVEVTVDSGTLEMSSFVSHPARNFFAGREDVPLQRAMIGTGLEGPVSLIYRPYIWTGGIDKTSDAATIRQKLSWFFIKDFMTWVDEDLLHLL